METTNSTNNLLAEKPKAVIPLLRYDGRYEPELGGERQWTLLSHFIDQNGHDRYKGSFGLKGLQEIGIVKNRNGENQL